MEWGRIVVPLGGADEDAALLDAAAGVAARMQAELAAVYAPPDPADLAPWLGEGFVGGVQLAAVEGLKDAAAEGEAVARAAFDACAYADRTFSVLATPVWRGLATEARLADLVVFDSAAARGRGALGGAFEQVLMEEGAATLVWRPGADLFGPAVVCWDGGEPASRSARRAAPLLRRCASVTLLLSPAPGKAADADRLRAYYARRGVTAEVTMLDRAAEPSALLLEAAESLGAGVMVAGAFGRSRVREFIFGGTTRALLNAERPSLFLAH